MKLHYHPISPYARKARIMAMVSGVEVEEIPPNKQAADGYASQPNPLGKIPCLERGGELPALFDSPVICEYLDSLSGHPLLPSSGEARWTQLRLHAVGDGLSDAVYNYRYETVRDDALHWPELIDRHSQAMRNALTYFEDNIDELGDDWNFGNMAIFCAIDYLKFRGGHIDVEGLSPRLAAWHRAMSEKPEAIETYGYGES